MKSVKHFLSLTLSSCMLLACQQQGHEVAGQSAENDLDHSLLYHQYSGAVLVGDESGIMFEKGYGKANREEEGEITAQTVFPIGSLGKQFTAAAILKLQEEGKLNVEDPVQQYFPEELSSKPAITIHQLLTHTSGIPENVTDGWSPVTEAQLLEAINNAQLVQEPGQAFHHSNSGYMLLGVLIERLSGQSMNDYMQEALFEPAGLQQTFVHEPKEEPANLAYGYGSGEVFTGHPYKNDPAHEGWGRKGAGDVFSSAADLYRWYEAIFIDGDVLSNESLSLFTKPHVAENEQQNSFYAYGWQVRPAQENRTQPSIWHDGGRGPFGAYMEIFPENDQAVVILLTNERTGEFEHIQMEIASETLEMKDM